MTCALLQLSGCTHIVTHNTPYYENGPNQPEGPQGELKEGTKAWVVGQDGSYVHVLTEDGVNAFVWDRSVMTIWDWNTKQDEDARQKQMRDSMTKQGATPPGQTEALPPQPPPADKAAK